MSTTTTSPRRLMTIPAAAELLAVSPRTVRRLIAEGELPAYRIGSRSLRVKASDVDELLRPVPAGDAL